MSRVPGRLIMPRSSQFHRSERLLNGWSQARVDIATPDLMKPREHAIGVGERFDSLCIGFELGSGNRKESDAVGEEIQICACAATAETERRATGIHDLR